MIRTRVHILFVNFIIYVYGHFACSVCVPGAHEGPKRVLECPEIRFTDNCEGPCGC